MTVRFFRSLAVDSALCAVAFGTANALQRPALAQTISVKCWKEVCVTDPETKTETCVREQIECPQEQ